MQIGLDFGTTNSTAAVFDGRRLHLVPLDYAAANPTVMRSVLFLGRDGRHRLGQAAIDDYIAGNVGRVVQYAERFLGQHEMLFAGTDGTRGHDVRLVADLYAVVDANLPGRLFQSLKMSLADEYYVATDVFGTRWTVEQLIAAQLREIRTRIETWTGTPISELLIGRPVHYSTTPEADALALGRMQRACELAELPPVNWMYEPVAAAHAYAMQIDRPRRVLVFDFGGGTLDVTIMLLDPAGRHEVLATDGVPIGGDQIDSRIVMGTLLPHFGAGATLGAQQRPLPAFLLEQLASWQQIMDLRTPRTLQIIDETINTGDRPTQLQTLRTLVFSNYGVPLYAEVEHAKCRLSNAEQTTIALDLDDIRLEHLLMRDVFEALIGPTLRPINACLDRVLHIAGLKAEEIDDVLHTGGSSRIPRFIRLLAERFGPDRLRTQDSFTTVAAGLALAAAKPA